MPSGQRLERLTDERGAKILLIAHFPFIARAALLPSAHI